MLIAFIALTTPSFRLKSYQLSLIWYNSHAVMEYNELGFKNVESSKLIMDI